MRAELKARLPHTWPAFFAPHGNFTEVQARAVPAILAGWDVLMVSATATGKTEAAIAPLLERYLESAPEPDTLRILYLCPTRALVRDLFARLCTPFAELGVSLTMKSGDTGPVNARRPPTVLITTPESLDSLLTRAPRILGSLQAVVLDEIHLFDRSPRGDQLRCLLRRIERIRDYQSYQRQGAAPPLQRVALSATVADPQRVAERYLQDAVVVEVSGGRRLEAEIVPLESLRDLVSILSERRVAKTLVFCNTRNEVEQVASYLRENLGFEAEVFVHYSNLDSALRREVETRFAAASVAICVSSSTLELGIDIGSIDEVALVGPPGAPSSFLQRVGRGGRREQATRVLCLPRSPREYLRFEALLNMAQRPASGGSAYHFRPSVLVQQVFSLLKQSPTGGLRFADLRRVAPAEITDTTLRRILDHLTASHYLRSWRPGEWQPGTLLQELADAQEIFSNIGGEDLGATIVDAYSGRKIARAERPRLKGEALLMGGRPVEVAWRDRFIFGVNKGGRPTEEALRFRTAPQAVPLELAQEVAARLGAHPNQLLCLPGVSGVWLFHFWGDIYGELLAALLRAQLEASVQEDSVQEDQQPLVSARNELCLLLPSTLDSLPPWEPRLVEAEVKTLQPQLEPLLELGRFQPLLPPEVALQSLLEQLDLPRLEALYRRAKLVSAPEGLRRNLKALL